MADASRPEPFIARSTRTPGNSTRALDLEHLAAELAETTRRVEDAEAELEHLHERLRRHEEAHARSTALPRRPGHRGFGALFGRAS
jgi:uncharacterized coiled-coil protein SlyX